VEPKYHRISRTFGGNYHLYGNRHIRTPNEPNGLVINFYVQDNMKDSATVSVTDEGGKTVYQRKVKAVKGFNSTVWNFSAGRTGARPANNEMEMQPGPLTVTLEVGNQKLNTKTAFKGVKGWPVN
jgi:hypothetical protein